MTTDIKMLSDEDLVDLLLALRDQTTYEDCCGSELVSDILGAELEEARAELLARLSEKEEVR